MQRCYLAVDVFRPSRLSMMVDHIPAPPTCYLSARAEEETRALIQQAHTQIQASYISLPPVHFTEARYTPSLAHWEAHASPKCVTVRRFGTLEATSLVTKAMARTSSPPCQLRHMGRYRRPTMRPPYLGWSIRSRYLSDKPKHR